MKPGNTEADRDFLRGLLGRWRAGEVDERFVHEEAERLWDANDQWPQYEESDPRSIALEVLSQLEVLNHQLITPEDIPAILDFLETPPGEEEAAWEKWRAHWKSVDYQERRAALASTPYYLV